jgi:hypothetical protein
MATKGDHGEKRRLLGSSSATEDDEPGDRVRLVYARHDPGCSWLFVATCALMGVATMAGATYGTFLWVTGTAYVRHPALLMFANRPPPPPPATALPAPPPGAGDDLGPEDGDLGGATDGDDGASPSSDDDDDASRLPPSPRAPKAPKAPPAPPFPPPPPKVDCESSVGDRRNGLYQQYNHECSLREGVPHGCTPHRGCQFCAVDGTPAMSGGDYEMCDKWVCEKYGMTGCKGLKLDKKAAKKERADVGDCKADVGNRKSGRHTFVDWDCAGEEGLPSGCETPGKGPCRFCVLRSGEPMVGWPKCPAAVCEAWDIEKKECAKR